MKPTFALLLTGIAIGGCSQTTLSGDAAKPAPKKPAVMRSTCADQFSETACHALIGCRWTAAYKRPDGTFATAYCSGRARFPAF